MKGDAPLAWVCPLGCGAHGFVRWAPVLRSTRYTTVRNRGRHSIDGHLTRKHADLSARQKSMAVDVSFSLGFITEMDA